MYWTSQVSTEVFGCLKIDKWIVSVHMSDNTCVRGRNCGTVTPKKKLASKVHSHKIIYNNN